MAGADTAAMRTSEARAATGRTVAIGAKAAAVAAAGIARGQRAVGPRDPSGPDLGGAALRVLSQFHGQPVRVVGSTFTGGVCSNGGALSSIGVSWDIADSTFTGNKAISRGANPARAGTAGGGSGGAIYLDGNTFTLRISGSRITGNSAAEGGGAIFFVSNDRTGTAAVTGSTVTQLRDDIYLIDVVARATGEERISLPTLRTLQVPLPNGRTVALGQFATFEYAQEYPMVWRRDRVPTLTVRADVAPGVLPESVVTDLAPAIDELSARLPEGYRIETGGIAEESAKSQASVFAVVPVMLLIMLTVLMFHLQSFQRLFMVLAILPLGLIGVVGALLVSGRPLGFVAILGILALIGMIAKNAVILITQIEADRAEGRSVWDAVLSASSSRLRPMSLTAISTVLGLIPIAPTVFWGPMAFAIMGGLLIATLLTLIFLPVLYVTLFEPGERRQAAAADA